MQFLKRNDNIFHLKNVELVNSIISEEDWDELFPARQQGYEYEVFLRAVAQYPLFCGEFKPIMHNLQTEFLACRRELATLFAHMVYETGDPLHETLHYE